MIREYIGYKCTCWKCSHQWTTKSHALPKVCPACKRITWNDDYVPEPITPDVIGSAFGIRVDSIAELPKQDKLAALRDLMGGTSAIPIESEPEEWHFTKDKPQFNTDDGNWYRLQVLGSNPRKTRTVQVDESNYSEIVCVK